MIWTQEEVQTLQTRYCLRMTENNADFLMKNSKKTWLREGKKKKKKDIKRENLRG